MSTPEHPVEVPGQLQAALLTTPMTTPTSTGYSKQSLVLNCVCS